MCYVFIGPHIQTRSLFSLLVADTVYPQALYFDIRKGAHSIGSNVRDAAAYVLWALARTQDPATLKPHATNLANRLASVAIYDREVHIRRAASAAYQEHVGRMVSGTCYTLPIEPRCTEYSLRGDALESLPPWDRRVGKDGFLFSEYTSERLPRRGARGCPVRVCLSLCASVSNNYCELKYVSFPFRHPEYRNFLLNHVLNVVLRHWDVSIRELGSQSLKNLCLIDLDNMATTALQAIVSSHPL